MSATKRSDSSSSTPQRYPGTGFSTILPSLHTAMVRSGCAAAKKRASAAPPVPQPSSAARSTPAASITARTSSMRVSRSGAPMIRSDMPVPRLSNWSTRIPRDRRRMNCPNLGCSQYTSRCEIHPWITTNANDPSPTSWYAIDAPSTVVAQRVVGTDTPPSFHFPRRTRNGRSCSSC